MVSQSKKSLECHWSEVEFTDLSHGSEWTMIDHNRNKQIESRGPMRED